MPDTKYSVNTAVDLITRRLPAGRAKAIPPDLLFPFILALVDRLAGVCQRTPVDAVEYITWQPERRPLLDWLFRTSEKRLAKHRAELTRLMARSWDGTDEEFDDVATAVWKAADEGRVTISLMCGLYGDAGRSAE